MASGLLPVGFGAFGSEKAGEMNIDATIVGIVPFSIQDEPYLTVYYIHDDEPDNILQARLPASAVYEHPHPNDKVRIHYVLGIVTHIDEREESNAARPRTAV